MASSLNKKQARIRRHHRVRNKVSGTAERPRLSVFKSNTAIYVQVIDDSNSKTLASSSTKTLKLSNSNIENATKVGKDIAKKLKKLKVTELVFDRGGYIYHGKVKAVADAVREEGIKI